MYKGVLSKGAQLGAGLLVGDGGEVGTFPIVFGFWILQGDGKIFDMAIM
jgi:hypothetical protein